MRPDGLLQQKQIQNLDNEGQLKKKWRKIFDSFLKIPWNISYQWIFSTNAGLNYKNWQKIFDSFWDDQLNFPYGWIFF